MATCSTISGFVDSWQRGKSVIECNLHMLETEDFTDVTFLVGSEKHVVRAHRYVLASRSCVFHAMFCGRMAEQGEITIPDIRENVFKDFLRFLYTDYCSINIGNVAGLLYTARKYNVESLLSQSAAFLETSLSEENLCEILEKSHGYEETEQKALKMLAEAGPKVIKTAGFLELCSECFETFLKSKDLNIKEQQVFEAALSWTKAECEREDLSPSHENMRKVLGEMVYEIRFLSLSPDFIADVVGPSEILTWQEHSNIDNRFLVPTIDISPFKSDIRIMIQDEESSASGFHSVRRFRAVAISLEGGGHAISFSTNKDITLLGCQLYGCATEQHVTMWIEVCDEQNPLIAHPTRFDDWALSGPVNDIMFPDPMSIKAGRVYTIKVVFYAHIHCVRGIGGVARVRAGGVYFTFMNAPQLNETSVEEGQIPGLIWQ